MTDSFQPDTNEEVTETYNREVNPIAKNISPTGTGPWRATS